MTTPKPFSLRMGTAKVLRMVSELTEDVANRVQGCSSNDSQQMEDKHVLASTSPGLDRSAFLEAVGRALSEPLDTTDDRIVVIVIDVDQFGALNASHGHDVGDQVLAQISSRIEHWIDDGTVARPSGDEFVVLCKTGRSAAAARKALEVQELLTPAIETTAGPLKVSVCMGTASVSSESAPVITPLALVRNAETACRNAKNRGRSQIIAYDDDLERHVVKRYKTENELRSAIDNRNLDLHFQPFYSLHSGEAVGVEALARWDHPILGRVRPSLFIPLAEESGLIDELSMWVLSEATKVASEWASEGLDVLTSMNLSSRQLLDPGLPRRVSQLLRDSTLDPSRLCLEVTESVVMNDVATSMSILCDLKDLGVCLAIDDFGSGYSSLSYLRRLPVDILKIDRSFTHSIYNRDDRIVIKAIIDLAHTLGMTTIAEGVETPMQAELLDVLDSDMAQGFLLHRPRPKNQIDFTSLDLSKMSDVTASAYRSLPQTQPQLGDIDSLTLNTN